MKKILSAVAGIVVIAAVTGYIFKDQLREAAFEQVTADMFVSRDDDGFNPGLAVGAAFPAIDAVMAGRTVTDASELLGSNGLLFVANRSVDW